MISKLKATAGAMSTAKKVIVIAAVLAVLCTITAMAADNASYYVELEDGKNLITIYTSGNSAEEVLRQADIKLSVLDSLDLSNFIPGEDSTIRVVHPNLVGVNDANGTVYFTFDGTVAEAIKAADVKVSSDDVVNYNEKSPVTDGMVISVARAFPITVSYHGKRINLDMAAGTVKDALSKAGVTPDEDDVLSHSLSDVVTRGMVVFVDKVVYKEHTETESIPFSSTVKKSSQLSANVEKVTQKGEDGEKSVTYKQKFVNGVLVDSVVKSEVVTKKPVNKIITVGTGKVYNLKANGTPYSNLGTVALDSNGIPLHYTKVISGSSTAYSGGKGTASGMAACVGHVAVDPKIIPYGTKLYIVATDGTVYGYAVAADTGGFIHDGKTVVDVYMASYEDSCKWGRKNVNMYVIG